MILSRWVEGGGAKEVHAIPGGSTVPVPAPNNFSVPVLAHPACGRAGKRSLQCLIASPFALLQKRGQLLVPTLQEHPSRTLRTPRTTSPWRSHVGLPHTYICSTFREAAAKTEAVLITRSKTSIHRQICCLAVQREP